MLISGVWPKNRVGQSMVFWIMNTNGKVIGQSKVSPLDPSDYNVNECKQRMSELDTTIKSSIGDYHNVFNVKKTEVPDLMTKISKSNSPTTLTSRNAIYMISKK